MRYVSFDCSNFRCQNRQDRCSISGLLFSWEGGGGALGLTTSWDVASLGFERFVRPAARSVLAVASSSLGVVPPLMQVAPLYRWVCNKRACSAFMCKGRFPFVHPAFPRHLPRCFPHSLSLPPQSLYTDPRGKETCGLLLNPI